jgi:hypothetical protein
MNASPTQCGFAALAAIAVVVIPWSLMGWLIWRMVA